MGGSLGRVWVQQGKQEAPAPFSLEKLSLPRAHGLPRLLVLPGAPSKKHLQPLLPEALDVRKAEGWGGQTGGVSHEESRCFLLSVASCPPWGMRHEHHAHGR